MVVVVVAVVLGAFAVHRATKTPLNVTVRGLSIFAPVIKSCQPVNAYPDLVGVGKFNVLPLSTV